jgi:hypothetical protein
LSCLFWLGWKLHYGYFQSVFYGVFSAISWIYSTVIHDKVTSHGCSLWFSSLSSQAQNSAIHKVTYLSLMEIADIYWMCQLGSTFWICKGSSCYDESCIWKGVRNSLGALPGFDDPANGDSPRLDPITQEEVKSCSLS